MAKQIKAIKCPQCGSSQKTQIKDDYYKCNNCGTEYFLDNDDININVKYDYPKRSTGAGPAIKALVVVVIFFLVFSTILFKTCFSSKRSSSPSSRTSYILPAEEFYDSNEVNKIVLYKGKPAVFTISSRNYRNMGPGEDSRNGVYYSYIDLEKGKILETVRLNDIKKISDAKYRDFPNGRTVFVLNKKILMELDQSSSTLKDVTESMFQRDSTYASGIASVEFVYNSYGLGFNVMTNLGKECYYYPLVNKTYTKDNYYDSRKGFNTIFPGASDSTVYAFTKKSITCRLEMEKQDEIQLLKIVYKYNAGGPENRPERPEWTDFRSKVPVLSYAGDNERVVSHKNLTPGRLYFNPVVVYSDSKRLLIKYSATAGEDAPKNIQSINPETGAILWTLPIEPEYDNNHFYQFTPFVDGKYYVKVNSIGYHIVGEDGKDYGYFKIPTNFK